MLARLAEGEHLSFPKIPSFKALNSMTLGLVVATPYGASESLNGLHGSWSTPAGPFASGGRVEIFEQLVEVR